MSPRSCLPCVAWLLLVSGVWGALGAQEETSATPPAESPAEPEAAPPPPSPPPPPPAGEGAGEGAERAEEVRAASEPTSESDLYLPLGPNLFPFYTHQLRTSDQTEILHILGLYRRTRSRRDGSHSLLILPFYFRDHAVSPPDDRLFLFPFYYHGVSPERAYRHLAPFYFSSSDPRSSFQLLLPFWMRETQEGGKLINHRVVPPLFRATWDDRLEDRSVFSMRLGFGKLLEFFEYRATPLTTDLAFVNFLNWGDVAESGGALYSYRWIQEDSGVRGRTHLFPFYWHGQGIESRYLWTIPLFGYWGTGGRDDYVVLPLLSRFGSGPGKDIRLNVLYRLFQYEQSEDEFSLAAMPFFNIFRSPSRHGFGVLTWIYTYAYDSEADRVDHTALWPFFHYSRTADDREGRQWLFPYYDTWDDEQATTLVLPIYGKRESRINGQPDRYFAVGLPTYFSFGTPTDYFSTGFPLYWAARTGERGWGVFFPFYLNFYSAVSQDLHVLPFFSNLRSPSRKLLAFGGPLYQYTRYYNSEERPSGSGHSLLWPFITVENRDDGYHYRFLPFFWVSKDQAASDLLLTPFYYHQSGEQGTLRYFFPAYARHQTPRVRRDFYALGTYMTSEYYAEDGALTESSRNFLWSLASFQKNHATQSTHQRILPLGFWRTSSPTEDLTVAGPFYYSHRRLAGDQVHHLQLFLGNLFLSKKVEGPPPREGPEVLRPVARDPGDAGEGDGRSTPGAPLERVVRSREGGVFWPLSRWYWNDQGSEGHWLLPFYFRTRSENTRTVGVFPLYFGQRNEGDYEPSYFRYFFLFDRETWSTGHRWSVAQLLFDYREDEVQSERRLRLLYPLFEIGSSETQYSYQVTPLLTGESVVASGGRSRTNRFFPLFWEGSRER
ncbi:MAG: hypothetical protein O7J95_11175, partial [Planctomycetota bacterium]|nr:hypothetical protein [Planctomycetota bacterium]